MKLGLIPLAGLLILCLAKGINSQVESKTPRHKFVTIFGTPLQSLKQKLAKSIYKLNDVRFTIGGASAKASVLLQMSKGIYEYLEELLETSSRQRFRCPVAGSLPSEETGYCYLLVEEPKLSWNKAHEYCEDLGGDLILPPPLFDDFGRILLKLFPMMKDFTIRLWMDCPAMQVQFNGVEKWVYKCENFLHYPPTALEPPLEASAIRPHLVFKLNPNNLDELIINGLAAIDTQKRRFICQFKAQTIFPRFSYSKIDGEDDTDIKHEKYMIDNENPVKRKNKYGEQNGSGENGYQNGSGENGYQNGSGENGYQDNGGENGYQNGGGENGYQNSGEENGYQNGGGENGYQNGGGENGYQNGGGENGYQNGSGENGYQNSGGENGYQNGGGENGYQNGGGENGYQNGGDENGYQNGGGEYDNQNGGEQNGDYEKAN